MLPSRFSLQALCLLVLCLYLPHDCAGQVNPAAGSGAAAPAKKDTSKTPTSSTQAPYNSSDDVPLIVSDSPPVDISDNSAKSVVSALGTACTAPKRSSSTCTATTLVVPGLGATSQIPNQAALDALLATEPALTLNNPWLKSAVDSIASQCRTLGGTALLLHFSEWGADGTVHNSTWHFYQIHSAGRGSGATCLLQEKHQADGRTPAIYAPSRVFFLGIDLFDKSSAAPVPTPAYALTTTATQPQNQSDLATLVGALAGASGGGVSTMSLNIGTPQATTVTAHYQLGMVFREVVPTEPPPYALNVSYFANGTISPAIGSITACYNSSCSYTRSFSVDDKEIWDVSLGLAIPGPTEAVYTASSSSTAKPSPSLKHHTDAYVLLDLYPLAFRSPKVSSWPHINAGIPITSQSLHRPYVGISEGLSQWFRLPIQVNVFGGAVFMKQQIYNGTGSTGLVWDRATKHMLGVEVPISGIASKLSSKGSKSNSSKSSTGS